MYNCPKTSIKTEQYGIIIPNIKNKINKYKLAIIEK